VIFEEVKMMNKVSKLILGLLVLVFVVGIAIQFIPYGHNTTNPPITGEPKWDSPRTRELFFRVCRDCHSNETKWPWYSTIAPSSWLTAHDVEEGRAAFNVSAWQGEGDEASMLYSSGRMPPWFYMPLHPEANLSASERMELIKGLAATFGGE
jgi:hypothetical protein